MKILIADDNEDDAQFLSRWLSEEGHECVRARDGEAALAILREETPDLLISDILMPRMDGFALCRAVKRDPVWRNIYFIFCTATYTDERDAALALQIGAQRFFAKPVEIDRLLAVLAEIEEGRAKPSVPAGESNLSEPLYLEMYNERLVSKLAENYRELQSTAAELRRQNAQLWALTEASQALSAAEGVGAVEQIAVQRALELCGAESVLLILREEHDLVINQATGRYAGLLHGLILPATGSVCAQLIAVGQVGMLEATRVRACATELLLPESPKAVMVAPLRVRGQPSGLLVAIHRREGAFAANALQSFELLAMETATALAKARLIEALREQSNALRLSQDQVVHNARMATVGRLTAALAHEINNPLQSILGSVNFVLEEVPPDFPQRTYLELAGTELDRVTEILQRMVGFYRRDTNGRAPDDVNALIRETLVLAEKQLQRHRVAVITALSPHLPPVLLAPNQMKQVFLNIILNAADAMPEGGQLEIGSQGEEAGQVMITFRDTGPGIAPREQERIFEAFYTTKAHGTGLGLAISRDIVLTHGGALTVSSEPGSGATFTVLLPAASAHDGADPQRL